MTDMLETRPSLLLRIRDARDSRSWDQFVELYTPLLYRFALKQGLQNADAEDITQEVLTAVSHAIGRLEYDPQQGKFRSWLFTIARNKIANQRLKRKTHPAGSGDSGMHAALQNHPAPTSEEEALWEREYEQRLFQWAAEQVRALFQPETWQAFWSTAVEDQPVAQVAQTLGISVGAVYIAKSRVLARMKDKIQELGDR
jgi:RNA polymerase sigma-70 factor (ECF subfamily)